MKKEEKRSPMHAELMSALQRVLAQCGRWDSVEAECDMAYRMLPSDAALWPHVREAQATVVGLVLRAGAQHAPLLSRVMALPARVAAPVAGMREWAAVATRTRAVLRRRLAPPAMLCAMADQWAVMAAAHEHWGEEWQCLMPGAVHAWVAANLADRGMACHVRAPTFASPAVVLKRAAVIALCVLSPLRCGIYRRTATDGAC